MKLLIVTQAVDRKHPELGFFVDWIEAIRMHPDVESLRVIAFDRSDTIIPGVDIIRINGGKFAKLIAFWKTISSDTPDVVLVHMTPAWLVSGWIIWVMRRVRMTLWYTHGSETTALRLATRLADEVYTATKAAFPIKSENVIELGHGIGDAYRAVMRMPRPEQRFAYLAVGRVMKRKRALETLKLFKLIHDIEPRATLTWIGDETRDPGYARMVRDFIPFIGLSDVVRMNGPSDQASMPEAYATHDLLLHLSETGSLDKVVIEALASGCPVMSTNPATKDGLGEAWYWDKPLDEAAAHAALSMLIQGVPSSERSRIAEQYDLRDFIGRLAGRLASLSGNKSRTIVNH